MTKGLPRSLAHSSQQRSKIEKKTIALRNVAITVAGLTGVGFGSAVIGDFPEGNILILGAVANLQFLGPTSANLVDTWTGNFGVGSTPASDGTITVGDVDMVASTALAAATAELSPLTRGTGATPAILDNTDGSLEINLNLLVADASIDANGVVITANGEVYLSYVILGDD